MIEFGGLRADAVEMGLIPLLFAEERQVGGCWRSSRATGGTAPAAPPHIPSGEA